MPGYQPVVGMGDAVQTALPNLVRRPCTHLFPGESLLAAVEKYPGRQRIVLGEGTYILIRNFEMDLANVELIGQGRDQTIIRMENESRFIWSGANGAMRDIQFDGIVTAAPRAAGYLIQLTGEGFDGERIKTVNGFSVIQATAAEQRLSDIRIEGQGDVGLLSTGNRAIMTEIRCDASAAALEIQINGADCYAPGLYCIGGGIGIGGAGTYSPAGSQWI